MTNDIAHLLDGPLLLVGAGKMGSALLEGWLDRGVDPGLVYVQDPAPSAEIVDLSEKFEFAVGETITLPGSPAVVVLAVKPQIMDKVLPGLQDVLGGDTVVLSVAAGRSVGSFAAQLGDTIGVVRAMPNTPASIGLGITGAYASDLVAQDQKDLCHSLLSAVGSVVWVKEEEDIDRVTAVSGSGPAYLFYLTECLADAGASLGLSPEVAMKLARATVCGAGELMRHSDLEAAELRTNVTSPGGTTQAALDVLMAEDDGLKPLMKKAVEAAKERARMLSS